MSHISYAVMSNVLFIRSKSSIVSIIEFVFFFQHWKHLCECSPEKHCLLYRHTLAELGDLVCEVSLVSPPRDNVMQNPHLLNDVYVPSKKV